MMNPRPLLVKPLSDYRLLILFKNMELKVFDVKPLFQYEVYQDLKNENIFREVKVDGISLYWNNKLDICPDMLYTKSIEYDYGEELSEHSKKLCCMIDMVPKRARGDISYLVEEFIRHTGRNQILKNQEEELKS